MDHPLLGLRQPEIGKLELRKQGTAIQLDADEWTTEVAKKVELDGVVKITTTLPPYVGFDLVPKVADGKQTVACDAGQHVYTFTRR